MPVDKLIGSRDRWLGVTARSYIVEFDPANRSERLVERIFDKLEGAYAPNTIVSYRADFKRFSDWCAANNAKPFPAGPGTVAKYIQACAKELKVSTLRRMVASIRRLHQLAAIVDPTTHVDVQFALRRVARRQSARPRQAKGITLELREKLMSTCGEDIRGLRDRALLAVGFETLARASELVSIDAEHLEESLRKGGAVLIARGKTDQSGYGRIVALSKRTTDILRAWMKVADIDRGVLFRPIYQGKVVPRRMTSHCVGRILKARAKMAGATDKEVAAISGHSLRVGAAQQLTLNGHGLPQVMRAGGWRSITTVSRYIEAAEMALWD
ncbi:MAG: tyrosine-type recombinase/integrase [Devosia sp.]